MVDWHYQLSTPISVTRMNCGVWNLRNCLGPWLAAKHGVSQAESAQRRWWMSCCGQSFWGFFSMREKSPSFLLKKERWQGSFCSCICNLLLQQLVSALVSIIWAPWQLETEILTRRVHSQSGQMIAAVVWGHSWSWQEGHQSMACPGDLHLLLVQRSWLRYKGEGRGSQGRNYITFYGGASDMCILTASVLLIYRNLISRYDRVVFLFAVLSLLCVFNPVIGRTDI